ncbi:MAG: ATP-binding cassette domain-containing protein [Flavobacteriales bacterium]
MNISFKNIIPYPLKESLKSGSSQIWDSGELELTCGKHYLVHAPSGKGKSTFLNILYGVRTDYDGSWNIGETAMNTNSTVEWDAARRDKLSMVFQGLELFDHLTALENINLKNDLTAFKSESQISEMMKRLEIEHLKHQNCGTLSFGQKQRVAIIRALCQPYNWLLLDEPFSHLDDANSAKAIDLIYAESLEQNAGVILTSLGTLKSKVFTTSLTL